MNISILTHPLGANYGGILQAYALSTYLREIGHNPIVLNRQSNLPLLHRIIKSVLVFFHHPRYHNPRYKYLKKFVKEKIKYSSPLSTSNQLSSFIKKNKIDAVIVGSDQVWRTDFAMGYGYNYFLDFVSDIKRISYAASFGLSGWKYTKEQTNRIEVLLAGFSAVSVREDEGVVLCRENLNIEATHVLDPTLLLHASDYDTITSKRLIDEDYVFVYWLGPEDSKLRALEKIIDNKRKIIDISLRGKEPLMPIESWLSYIKYADFVVTDSYHGCVFSILFNKQFRMSSNDSGGNGRLESLFKMLQIDTQHNQLDYLRINNILDIEREKSYNFIKTALQ